MKKTETTTEQTDAQLLSNMQKTALEFLNSKMPALNINYISRQIFNTEKPLMNFHEMISGKRKMPKNYIQPLYEYLNDTFQIGSLRALNQVLQNITENQEVEKIVENPKKVKEEKVFYLPENSFLFTDSDKGVSIQGEGFEARPGKTPIVLIKGERSTDFGLIQKTQMAVSMADKLFKELKK